MYCEEVDTCGIYTCDDQVCADMSLISEEVLLEHGHAGDDARLAACGEGVQLEVGRDDGRGELGVSGGTSTSAPDLRGNEVQLLAVLQAKTD